ncbi:MAG: LacI family DNA-binding transcriptional regulator [Pseudomonadota bacterium]
MGRTANVSIKDVAARAGVSIASVSRVVNDGSGTVSENIRTKVLQAVRDLNYNPNRIGRALRQKSTDTYALVISNIQNNFYAAVAWEVERLLNDMGRAVLLFSTNENPTIQDQCLDEIRSRQVAGIFMLCAVDSPGLRAIRSELEITFINRRIVSMPDVPFIGIDDFTASKELMRKVLKTGVNDIGIIHGPLTSDTSARRLRGMKASLDDMGIEVPSHRMFEALLSMEGGYASAQRLLDGEPPQVIICGTDQIAYGVYRRCRELALDVPNEVSVYGFDDNPLNEWLAPWLNTVRVPHLDLARAAVDSVTRPDLPHTRKDQILPYQIILRI